MKENPNTQLQEKLKEDFDYGLRTLQKEQKNEEEKGDANDDEEPAEQTLGNKEEDSKDDPSSGFFDSISNQNDLNRDDRQKHQGGDRRA